MCESSLRDCIAWWAEPASWIAAVGAMVVAALTLYVAVWLGLPQLRYIREEQERIRKNLSRRAELQTMLSQPSREQDRWDYVSEIEISPTWSNGPLSDQIT